jgi:hypothetical protein
MEWLKQRSPCVKLWSLYLFFVFHSIENIMPDNNSLLYLKAAIEAARVLTADQSLPSGSVVMITITNALGEYINSSSCQITPQDLSTRGLRNRPADSLQS